MRALPTGTSCPRCENSLACGILTSCSPTRGSGRPAKNTLYYLIPIPFYLTFALAFAYSCHKKILGEKVFRVLYYLPFISSIVALTLIWKWLFNAKYGLVNLFLGLFGIAGPDWLGDPVWTRRMIVIMISWKMIGIISIYYIAALKNVPSTYYEAAKIDGASSWQQFKRITLPLLTPTTFYLIVTGMIGSLQTFLEVNLFAPDGGRGYGVGSIVFYIWQKAFDSSQMGYACACATVFGVAMIILTAVQFTVSRKWVYEGMRSWKNEKLLPSASSHLTFWSLARVQWYCHFCGCCQPR